VEVTSDDATAPDEQGGILRSSSDGPAITVTHDALDLIGAQLDARLGVDA
jgi:hypothetical protein